MLAYYVENTNKNFREGVRGTRLRPPFCGRPHITQPPCHSPRLD
nr:hypothetical protein RVX_2363 [Nitratidesulfovibrio sp. HK-II]